MRTLEQYLVDEGKFAKMAALGAFALGSLGGQKIIQPSSYSRTRPSFDTLQIIKLKDDPKPQLNADIQRNPMPQENKRSNGIELAMEKIKKSEGFWPKAKVEIDGLITIGYGFTRNDIPDLQVGDGITRQDADQFLHELLTKTYVPFIDKNVKVELNANQKAALISFVYNVGPNAFKNSTLLKKLNAGDYLGASKEMLRWGRMKGRRIAGLAQRRQSEREMFLSDPD